jgi:plastocyanin
MCRGRAGRSVAAMTITHRSHRLIISLAAAITALLCVAALWPAVGQAASRTKLTIASATAGPKAPTKQKLAIVGHSEFKVNKLAFDNQRFSKSTFAIRSGGTVTLRNRARTEDPHTISLVKKSQLPTSFDCEVCDEIFGAHGPDEATGNLASPVVDVGAPGYDQPGDSTFIPPHGRVSFNVTAPAGTTLHFICAIHPWMQGRIKVR